jgi:hypothetical protein
VAGYDVVIVRDLALDGGAVARQLHGAVRPDRHRLCAQQSPLDAEFLLHVDGEAQLCS